MKKYPVISKNGNEYEVKVNSFKGMLGIEHNIRIYRHEKRWYGDGKRLLNSVTLYNPDFKENYNSSYVEAVKSAVENYEELIYYPVIEFGKWDGKC